MPDEHSGLLDTEQAGKGRIGLVALVQQPRPSCRKDLPSGVHPSSDRGRAAGCHVRHRDVECAVVLQPVRGWVGLDQDVDRQLGVPAGKT